MHKMVYQGFTTAPPNKQEIAAENKYDLYSFFGSIISLKESTTIKLQDKRIKVSGIDVVECEFKDAEGVEMIRISFFKGKRVKAFRSNLYDVYVGSIPTNGIYTVEKNSNSKDGFHFLGVLLNVDFMEIDNWT